MVHPTLTIGDHAVFARGYNFAYDKPTDEPVFIKIDGAIFKNDEWHYFSNSFSNSQIMFPESALSTDPA